MKRFSLCGRKFRGVGFCLLILCAIYLSTYIFSYVRILRYFKSELVVSDVSRLNETKVASIFTPQTAEELQKIVTEAWAQEKKIALTGSHHSQGGHIATENGVTIDMRALKRVLNVDRERQTITVEAGAKWSDVQQVIAPLGLAVKVMQSSNLFTVGGTMSANAHGRDIDITTFVETVLSFKLLRPDGQIVNVSREENAELFGLVIGGYGVFGVILEVTLKLTRDELYERTAEIIDYREFPEYFKSKVKDNSKIALLLARPSIDPDSFLREMTVTVWSHSEAAVPSQMYALTEEEHVWRDRFLFGLSRDFDWAKSLRWWLQKKVELGLGEKALFSRNNSMRPPAAPLEFLDHDNFFTTDIIQEYYVPTRNFVAFMDEFRSILLKREMNVISSTVRYVSKNSETRLAYAPKEDAFAIIHMSSIPLSESGREHARLVTQELIDAALKHEGTYYLTYQSFASVEQFRKAYPRFSEVAKLKAEIDPKGRFSNRFYETYLKTGL